MFSNVFHSLVSKIPKQPRVVRIEVLKHWSMSDDDLEAWQNENDIETLPDDFAGNIWYPTDHDTQVKLAEQFAQDQVSPDIEIFHDSILNALVIGKPQESSVDELQQYLTIDLLFKMINSTYKDFQQTWSMGKIKDQPIYFLVIFWVGE